MNAQKDRDCRSICRWSTCAESIVLMVGTNKIVKMRLGDVATFKLKLVEFAETTIALIQFSNSKKLWPKKNAKLQSRLILQ